MRKKYIRMPSKMLVSGIIFLTSSFLFAQTELLKTFPNLCTSCGPQEIEEVNGTIYVDLDNNDFELWKTDGTPTGTVLVFDDNSSGNYLTNINNKLVFGSGATSTELWTSDGTTGGTVLLKEINATGSSNPGFPSDIFVINNIGYFTADDGVNGKELWKTDGTALGTVLVKDINPGIANSTPNSLANLAGTLIFLATDAVNGKELWKSDGTAEGTVLVKDINVGSTGLNSGNTIEFTLFNNELYFVASDGVNGYELWKTDGTTTGTAMAFDLVPGGVTSSSTPQWMTVFNGMLYFQAIGSAAGIELWKSDGTLVGTSLVKDINPGNSDSNPEEFIVVNNTLLFIARTATENKELWKTDGTSIGTVLVKDIKPGNTTSSLGDFTLLGNQIFFRANDGVNGTELWMSDGTPSGTVMAEDITVGSVGSSPVNFKVINGVLYFSGKIQFGDSKLYKYTPIVASVIAKEKSGLHLTIYPNPTEGKFTISIESESIQNNLLNVSVVNSVGEVLVKKYIGDSVHEIDLSGYPAGIYFLSIESELGVTTKKIVIE